jgi:hypothetical protein
VGEAPVKPAGLALAAAHLMAYGDTLVRDPVLV